MNQSKDVRNIQKKFKINKAEEILLTQRINKSGLTASEYIRQSVLHDNPVAVIDKANIIIPQLADISSLTNDLLDCDTLRGGMIGNFQTDVRIIFMKFLQFV